MKRLLALLLLAIPLFCVGQRMGMGMGTGSRMNTEVLISSGYTIDSTEVILDWIEDTTWVHISPSGFTATSDQDWCTTSTDDSLFIYAEASGLTADRTATITIGAQTITVTQRHFDPTELDANTWGWWNPKDATTITKDGSNRIAQINDLSGNDRHLTQSTDGYKPLYQGAAAYFDGSDDFILVNSALARPMTVYAVLMAPAYEANPYFFDGYNINYMVLMSPSLELMSAFAGAYLPPSPYQAIEYGHYMTITVVYNGANSYFKNSAADSVTGDIGTFGGDPNGFTMGAGGGGANCWANVSFKEVILRTGVDNGATKANIQKWLNARNAEKVDMWVLAGQSNAEGRDSVENITIDGYTAKQDSGYILHFTNINIDTLKPGTNTGTAPRFGIETSFAKRMAAETGRKQLIVKYAVGATSLARYPLVTGNWSPDTTGSHYDMLKLYINRALDIAKLTNMQIKVRGVLWLQGEEDATREDAANAYHDNLIIFCDSLSNFLTAKNTQLGTNSTILKAINKIHTLNPATYWQTVAENQVSYCADHGGRLVSEDGLALMPETPYAVHIDADGLITLGIRNVSALKNLIE